MKWILFYIIVTSNGVTESQSDFGTYEQCIEAAEAIHVKYVDHASLIQTKCELETDYDG